MNEEVLDITERPESPRENSDLTDHPDSPRMTVTEQDVKINLQL